MKHYSSLFGSLSGIKALNLLCSLTVFSLLNAFHIQFEYVEFSRYTLHSLVLLNEIGVTECVLVCEQVLCII